MSWETGDGELRTLQALPAADRAVHLVQLAADWDEVWGLQDDRGWVVSKEMDAFPLWPHPELARACARGNWEGAEPAPIALEDLLEDLLPLLAEDALRVALFPTPEDPGLLLAPGELRQRLQEELELGLDTASSEL
ncbi:MAG TPA: DUF2750 domain-containing protein [Thermoanaerobaculia bacterium]|nr:DUF2750 domain-containing protein [Thermoanaerobaculia bacterium]